MILSLAGCQQEVRTTQYYSNTGQFFSHSTFPDSAKAQVFGRPLAGTRRRGRNLEEDQALERELLADEKECSEHVMLVDLGRNDVGKVAQMGSVDVETFMEVERYSHVMHISSTVKGKLLPQLNAWDVMRAALPAGTVSGAPKVGCAILCLNPRSTLTVPYVSGCVWLHTISSSLHLYPICNT